MYIYNQGTGQSSANHLQTWFNLIQLMEIKSIKNTKYQKYPNFHNLSHILIWEKLLCVMINTDRRTECACNVPISLLV